MLARRAVLLLTVLLSASTVLAQVPDSIFDGITRRDIGPVFMSGRITDFAVYEDDPSIFYAASASGGLLKTINGGTRGKTSSTPRPRCRSATSPSTRPIRTSCGWAPAKRTTARAPRGATASTSRSTAARPGRTWGCASRSTSAASSSIRRTPTSSTWRRVGRLWGANKERGVFKTTDGGVTWQHVLAINENTGASGPDHGSREFEGAVSRPRIRGAAPVGLQRRRAGLRHLQEHRRRPDLAQARWRPAGGRHGPHRPRLLSHATRTSSTPSSRTATAACSARRTKARRGPRSTASIRGRCTSARSASIPMTRSGSTSTASTCTSPTTAARRSATTGRWRCTWITTRSGSIPRTRVT